MENRSKQIIKTSVIGIIMNVILSTTKMIVGLFVGAISVILDGVNNLSDAISQVVNIIGTAFANKAPDKEHPFGHGRIEYVTGQIIAAIIISIGIISMREAIVKIIEPGEPDYKVYTIVILIIAIVFKIAYSIYTRIKGKKLKSQNLVATSIDSLMDAFLTLGTLISGVIVMLNGFNIEGYVGCVISLLIMKAGIELMRDSIKSLIGERTDPEVSKSIKDLINSYDEVIGAYDLILHEYGPTKTIGSVHIEVDEKMTASEIHTLTRKISEEVYAKMGIFLTIGIYATNDSNTEIKCIKDTINEMVSENKDILEIHGFFVKDSKVSFDLVFDFSCKDKFIIVANLKKILEEKYPNYQFDIIIDNDITD